MNCCQNPDCGAPLPDTGKPKRFCCDNCRKDAWRRFPERRIPAPAARPRLACGCVDTGLRSHKGTPICLKHRTKARRERLSEGFAYTATSGQRTMS